jgi:signal transduction histidine kinase
LILAAVALLVLLNRTLLADVDAQARLRMHDVAALAMRGALPDTLAGEDDGTVAQVVTAEGAVLAQSPIIHGGPMAPFVPAPGTVEVRSVERVAVGDGGPFRVAATQVDTPSGPVVVYAGVSLEPLDDAMVALRVLLAVAVPLLILLVGVTTWRLAGRTLRPVEAIRRQVAEISATALDRRVPEPAGADEIGRLARTMNAMLDRLDAAARRQRAFVSDASHELRSPLAAIRVRLEVALAGPAPADWSVVAKDWLAEQSRLERLVDDLLLLARLDEGARPPDRAVVDLDELVLDAVRSHLTRARARFDVTGVSGGRVLGDAGQLRQVVVNLLDNAERHASSAVRCALSQDGDTVELVVADDGPGIAPADRRRVFERFVRLDESRDRRGGGTGLGLAIVREVVTRHGGTVEIADSPGATVIVRLPAGSGAAEGGA